MERSLFRDSFFTGSIATTDEVTGATSEEGGLSLIKKIATYLFVPYVIEGIPAVISLIIGLVNIISISIASIYTYDKIRGIGS